MSKIILFSRTSTTEQDIEQQTKDLVNEAKHLGYPIKNHVVIEYQESGIKLDASERLGIQKLKEAVLTDKDIDCVLCWELTRIARRADVIYNIRDFLLEHKKRWIVLKPSFIEIIDKDGNLTQTSYLLLGIFTAFAEQEMMLKAERFMRAKNELTKQGKKAAGAVVFGYMKNKDKYCVPHPRNSLIIVDLFNYYLEDASRSVYEVYKYACQKYPDVFQIKNYTRSHRRMMSLFNQAVYKGNWCYPPLITEEMWNAAQEKQHKAKCLPRYESKCKILGRGKVYCGHCGHMLTPVGGKVKGYNCSFKDGKHSITISTKILDDLIWEETRVIANINASTSNNTKITELTEQIKQKKVLLTQQEKLKQESEQKLSRLADLYINGRINSDILSSKQSELTLDDEKIKNNITLLNAEIKSLEDVLEKSQKDLMNIKSLNYDNISSFEVRQELVRKYISKVLVERTEPRIYEIKFEYNSGIFIVQQGHYIYEGKNKFQKVYRLNQDGTEDRII